MLTGMEIQKEIELGRIEITPFNPGNLQPNSIDVCLSPLLKRVRFTEYPRISGQNYIYEDVEMPEHGRWILPGEFWLACTIEKIGSDHWIPCIEGKSSNARKSLSVHSTAGFGDLGFHGQFTLEMTCTLPVFIFPLMLVAQVYFLPPIGDTFLKYGVNRGSYQGQMGPTPHIVK